MRSARRRPKAHFERQIMSDHEFIEQKKRQIEHIRDEVRHRLVERTDGGADFENRSAIEELKSFLATLMLIR